MAGMTTKQYLSDSIVRHGSNLRKLGRILWSDHDGILESIKDGARNSQAIIVYVYFQYSGGRFNKLDIFRQPTFVS